MTRHVTATGPWPGMRAETVKNIVGTLAQARRQHPTNQQLLHVAKVQISVVETALNSNQLGGDTATVVYSQMLALAVTAIRLLEEGDGAFGYASYLDRRQGSVDPLDYENHPSDCRCGLCIISGRVKAEPTPLVGDNHKSVECRQCARLLAHAPSYTTRREICIKCGCTVLVQMEETGDARDNHPR